MYWCDWCLYRRNVIGIGEVCDIQYVRQVHSWHSVIVGVNATVDVKDKQGVVMLV